MDDMDEFEMRLQALMRQEYVPQIRVPQENDMDDLQERLYRLEPRHRQLRISDYPLLRNRMIHESMGNIPIIPETYNVADPVGELRNMASSRIQRHNRHKLTRGRRLNKAKNRLSIAKIPELDYDTARLLGEKYIKKGGGSNTSSNLSNEQEQFDEFLTGIREPYNPYPDMAKSMTALRNIDTPLHDIDDLAILDRISSYVGPARNSIKLKRLKTSNMDLILNFKSNVRNLNDRGLSENVKDNYYAEILFKNTRNQNIDRTYINFSDYTLTLLQSMFKIPNYAAITLIDAILEFEDEIDPAYSEVTLPRLLKYLIIDNNLDIFITSFRLILGLRGEYSEIEKETFINNFLKKIQP
jgi:hypothetical protein